MRNGEALAGASDPRCNSHHVDIRCRRFAGHRSLRSVSVPLRPHHAREPDHVSRDRTNPVRAGSRTRDVDLSPYRCDSPSIRVPSHLSAAVITDTSLVSDDPRPTLRAVAAKSIVLPVGCDLAALATGTEGRARSSCGTTPLG